MTKEEFIDFYNIHYRKILGKLENYEKLTDKDFQVLRFLKGDLENAFQELKD